MKPADVLEHLETGNRVKELVEANEALTLWADDLIEYIERCPQIIHADMADSIRMLKKAIAKGRMLNK